MNLTEVPGYPLDARMLLLEVLAVKLGLAIASCD
jgi:hypothetical protein